MNCEKFSAPISASSRWSSTNRLWRIVLSRSSPFIPAIPTAMSRPASATTACGAGLSRASSASFVASVSAPAAAPAGSGRPKRPASPAAPGEPAEPAAPVWQATETGRNLNALYGELLGRDIDPYGLEQFGGMIDRGEASLAEIRRQILRSPEYLERMAARAEPPPPPDPAGVPPGEPDPDRRPGAAGREGGGGGELAPLAR